MTAPKNHRHFLVAPLLAVALIVSFLPAVFQATLSEQTPFVGSISYEDGTYVHTFSDGQFEAGSRVLRSGSALIMSEGVGEVRAGAFTLLNFGGAYHLTRYDDNISIAALTSPVLIEQDHARFLLPSGQQWRSQGKSLPVAAAGFETWLTARSTSNVPRDFLRDQLKLIGQFQHEATAVLPTVSRWNIRSFLALLPGARWRQQQRASDEALAYARQAVEKNDVSALEEALQDTDDTSRTIRLLALLVTRAPSSAVQLPLMDAVAADADVWLLMAEHPQYNTIAWSAQLPAIDAEHAFVLWLLPASDMEPNAISDLSFTRWQSVASDTIEQDDPASVLPLLLPRYSAIVDSLHTLGFPLRARRLALFTIELAQKYADQIPSVDVDALLNHLRAFDTVSAAPVESNLTAEAHSAAISAVQEKSVPQEQTVLNPEELSAIANSLLEKAGALFTVQTTIEPIANSNVAVTNIVFSTPKRDRTFGFILNAQAQAVHDIVEGDRTYPYSLEWDAFVDWAKK